ENHDQPKTGIANRKKPRSNQRFLANSITSPFALVRTNQQLRHSSRATDIDFDGSRDRMHGYTPYRASSEP
ncbi:MAG TPA: hypothetical protein VGU20_19330, partial [Stellaceae bacterium]|nr:hypothetical protein [Stellaceae bacterium]